jgi:hypothetical protein
MIEFIALSLIIAFMLGVFDGSSESSSGESSCPCGGRGYWPIANDRGSFPVCQLCRVRG